MQAPSKVTDIRIPRRSKRAKHVHTLTECIKELTIQKTEHEFKLKAVKKKLAGYEHELQTELDVVR